MKSKKGQAAFKSRILDCLAHSVYRINHKLAQFHSHCVSTSTIKKRNQSKEEWKKERKLIRS